MTIVVASCSCRILIGGNGLLKTSLTDMTYDKIINIILLLLCETLEKKHSSYLTKPAIGTYTMVMQGRYRQ